MEKRRIIQANRNNEQQQEKIRTRGNELCGFGKMSCDNRVDQAIYQNSFRVGNERSGGFQAAEKNNKL